MVSAGRFSTYVNYMRRFFRPATEGGYARVTGGNQLAAAANDEWDFLTDPARLGEDTGWWRAERRYDDAACSSALVWSVESFSRMAIPGSPNQLFRVVDPEYICCVHCFHVIGS